ncbi:MAG: ABC transporter permease [Dehalococcoidia bacterium]
MTTRRRPRWHLARLLPRNPEPTVGRAPSRFWQIREEIPVRWRWILGGVSLIAPLVIWVVLVQTGSVNPIFLPSPLEVVQAGRDMVSSGVLRADTWASLQRVAIGFGIAIAISVPLGLAMGTFRSVQALFEPVIGFVRYMPATAFVPLLVIWLGLDEAPKIALIVIGTVFFNTLMTANIVWSVPTELIRVSFTLGAGAWTVFRKVIFPYALPGMIDAMRVNLAAAWNLIVVAELFAATEGLGYRIVRAQKFLQIEQIFVVLIVIGALGLTSDLLLRTLRNRLAPWSQE